MDEFKEVTNPYIFRSIENLYEKQKIRAYELHSKDVLYCDLKFMEKQRYYQELLLGQTVYLNGTVAARVTKVFK